MTIKTRKPPTGGINFLNPKPAKTFAKRLKEWLGKQIKDQS